jgi:hypothetical protein
MYTASYDSLVANSNQFNGNTPINHGFRVQIFNDATVRLNIENLDSGGISKPLGYIWSITNSRYPVIMA